MLVAEKLLEVSVAGVVGILDGVDGDNIVDDVFLFLGVSGAGGGRIKRRLEVEAAEGLKGMEESSDLANEVVVGVGPLLDRLVNMNEGAESDEEKHVFALGVLDVGDYLVDTIQNPDAIACGLSGVEVGGVAHAAPNGEAALSQDGIEEGKLRIGDLCGFRSIDGDLRLAHHRGDFRERIDLGLVGGRLGSGRICWSWRKTRDIRYGKRHGRDSWRILENGLEVFRSEGIFGA